MYMCIYIYTYIYKERLTVGGSGGGTCGLPPDLPYACGRAGGARSGITA